MKKILLLLLLLFASTCSFAQESVLSFAGELYFIPGAMTKDGDAFLVSVNSQANGDITIYDDNFNIVRKFSDPTAGQPYQQRVVTMTRIYDPSADGWGAMTRAASVISIE